MEDSKSRDLAGEITIFIAMYIIQIVFKNTNWIRHIVVIARIFGLA